MHQLDEPKRQSKKINTHEYRYQYYSEHGDKWLGIVPHILLKTLVYCSLGLRTIDTQIISSIKNAKAYMIRQGPHLLPGNLTWFLFTCLFKTPCRPLKLSKVLVSFGADTRGYPLCWGCFTLSVYFRLPYIAKNRCDSSFNMFVLSWTDQVMHCAWGIVFHMENLLY